MYPIENVIKSNSFVFSWKIINVCFTVSLLHFKGIPGSPCYDLSMARYWLSIQQRIVPFWCDDPELLLWNNTNIRKERRGRVKFYDPYYPFYDPNTNPDVENKFSYGELILTKSVISFRGNHTIYNRCVVLQQCPIWNLHNFS